MGEPRGRRGPGRPRSTFFRRRWVVLGAVLAGFLLLGGVGAVALRVTETPETLSGVQAPAQFLKHWQQVGSETGVTPGAIPRGWSVTVGTPSRLPRFAGSYRIDAATAGHMALVWLFNETVGVTTSVEIEMYFHIVYEHAAATYTSSITVYIETQRTALIAPLTFTVYWDSGYATGVTFVNQLEFAQACSAIGTCP